MVIGYFNAVKYIMENACSPSVLSPLAAAWGGGALAAVVKTCQCGNTLRHALSALPVAAFYWQHDISLRQEPRQPLCSKTTREYRRSSLPLLVLDFLSCWMSGMPLYLYYKCDIVNHCRAYLCLAMPEVHGIALPSYMLLIYHNCPFLGLEPLVNFAT